MRKIISASITRSVRTVGLLVRGLGLVIVNELRSV